MTRTTAVVLALVLAACGGDGPLNCNRPDGTSSGDANGLSAGDTARACACYCWADAVTRDSCDTWCSSGASRAVDCAGECPSGCRQDETLVRVAWVCK